MTVPKRVRDAVYARAKDACEGCGRSVAVELHHRKFRSRGGKHTIPNVVALCGWGNHTGCHGRAHSADPPVGWAVHSWDDPILVPFASPGGLVWLTVDGRAVPVGADVEF